MELLYMTVLAGTIDEGAIMSLVNIIIKLRP